MKYVLTLFFLIFLFRSKGQTPEVYRSYPDEESCSGKIFLYPDYTYVYQNNCKVFSSLSFGKWFKEKKSVMLRPVNPKSYTVIQSVKANTIPGDSIWLTVLDKQGINMTSKISTGLEVKGVGSYMFNDDSTGLKKFVYKRKEGRMVFRTLNKLFGQRLELATDTANNFIVTLNILSEWITGTHSDWNATGTIFLIQKGESLIEPFPKRKIFQKIKTEDHTK